MNPELISLLTRLVVAHEILAQNVGRIADQMTIEASPSAPETGLGVLSRSLNNLASEVADIAEKMPVIPEPLA